MADLKKEKLLYIIAGANGTGYNCSDTGIMGAAGGKKELEVLDEGFFNIFISGVEK